MRTAHLHIVPCFLGGVDSYSLKGRERVGDLVPGRQYPPPPSRPTTKLDWQMPVKT